LEHLRLLSNLEKDGQKLLHIVLVGRRELEGKIGQPGMRQLKQRIAIRCRVKCLQDEEIEPFITLRLQTVGLSWSTALFHSGNTENRALFTRNLRVVNVICDNASLIAFSLSLKEVSEEIIDEVAKDFRLDDEARKKQEEYGGGDAAAWAQAQPDVPQSPDSPLISVAERQSSWEDGL